MPEVAAVGEDHRAPGRLHRLDHVVVALRPARLDDCGDALLQRQLDAVGEREERIRGEHGAFERVPERARLVERDPDRVDAARLAALRQARALARERVWLARGELTGMAVPPARAGGRDLPELVIDVDATLVEVHSDKEGASGHYKGGYGFHPLLAFLDNTNEALAGGLRTGRAGSNTAADHIALLDLAVAQIPMSIRHQHGYT